ncbi:MAG: PEGA domain-containing protein [Acidobacteriia bacterium]|nr:PEGA domain-containing protein [Terriglobia bacterium]
MIRKFCSLLVCLCLVIGTTWAQTSQSQSSQQSAPPANNQQEQTAPAANTQPATTPAEQTPAAQTPSAATPAATPATTPATPALTGFGLEDGTPVKLRLTRNLSSGSDKTGDKVDFEVLEEVKIDNLVVIPRGGIAWATITEAQPKRRMGRGGKLNVNIDNVRLVDGEKANLRAVKDTKGGGHVGAMTGAMVATGIIFFPAAPLFLFMHGKDIEIPKGTEITAYVAGNTLLDRSKFVPADAAGAQPAPKPAEPAQTTVVLTSTPAGADVEVDGSFVGNTPSTITLTPGDHSLKIIKRDYKTWERQLKATGGNISINAEMESAK